MRRRVQRLTSFCRTRYSGIWHTVLYHDFHGSGHLPLICVEIIRQPNWRNQVTLESLGKMREFDPAGMVHMMSPTALLFIPAEKDIFCPPDVVKAIYEKAREPKAITVLPIRHFETYNEPWVSKAASAAINWFKEYL